jgi:hypothetical protein
MSSSLVGPDTAGSRMHPPRPGRVGWTAGLEKFLLKMELVACVWMKFSSKHGIIYQIKRTETMRIDSLEFWPSIHIVVECGWLTNKRGVYIYLVLSGQISGLQLQWIR